MVADLSRAGGATYAGFDSSSAGGSGSMTSSAAADQTPAPVGRVEAWSMSFEALLRDSAGIHTFAEYLKKEFSHENIYFWVAVQRYKVLFEKDGDSQQEGNITDKEKEERIAMAKEIYERHISPSAVEAVNVDCHAQKFIGENFTKADSHLFTKAEQQVFSLMKYDTYVRFLKSQMYKDALQADNDDRELPFPGGDQMEADLRTDASGNQAEGDSRNDTANQKHVGRRRSLLGWGKRSRAKSRESRPRSRTRAPRASSLRRLRSKDPKAQETVEVSNNSQHQQMQPKTAASASARDGSVHSNTSRMSLASSDLAMISRNFSTSQESLPSDKECTANASTLSVSSNGKENQTAPLCRMILPDQSTTVVPLTPGESIRSLINRLLDKKGLHYSATDVYTINSNVPIDQTKDSIVLSCQEVRVEHRVLIRFIFPGDKPFAVKVGPGRKLYEVLRPILSAHNSELQRMTQQTAGSSSRSVAHLPAFKADHFTAHRTGDETASLSMKTLATNLDNETIVLKYKEGAHGNPLSGRGFLGAAGAKKLDEITNRVFLDLMRSKSVTDADKVPTDDSSSQSSGICGSLIRRNSIHVDRDISVKALTPPEPAQDVRGATGVSSSGQESLLKSVLSPPRLFLDDPGDQPSPSREELYMELKKADKLRLDDQRGTKLNCEIPDFLRPQPLVSATVEDKENELKNRPVRMDESDFLRAPSSGSFMNSRSGESSAIDASSLYDYAASMMEVSQSIYGTRRNPNASTTAGANSDHLHPYGTIDLPPSAARRITSRRTAIGIPSNNHNAGPTENFYEPAPVSSRQNKRLLATHQVSPPPPLPPKPKTFRAPPSLRPPPPPPPHRRAGGFEPIDDGLDYLAPPRAVRRSDRLSSAASMTTASAKPMSNISFV